jgi:RNA recognition motif-containing protein
MKLYVGNLPHSTTDQELQDLFAPYGEIKSVNIIKDKFSGQSRGFGFVEMGNSEMGQAAISALDGSEVAGRKIKVNEAIAKEARPGGGRGGFGGNRGGSRGGFGGNRGGGSRGGFGGNRDGGSRGSW